MLLPLNGKVMVLDNEPKEAAPLLKILSKNKIPHVYFSGDVSLLPAIGDPFDDVRLVFLDVNLTDGTDDESTLSQLSTTLERLIKPGTPYVAAIWSNKQEKHRDLLKRLFNEKAPELKPVASIMLGKSDFFIYDPESGYELDPARPEILAEIQARIDEVVNQVDSVNILIAWENIIHEAASDVIQGLASIAEYDEHWNENLKHILYKLAYAQLGKTIGQQSDGQTLKASLVTMIDSFVDQAEMKLAALELPAEFPLLTTPSTIPEVASTTSLTHESERVKKVPPFSVTTSDGKKASIRIGAKEGFEFVIENKVISTGAIHSLKGSNAIQIAIADIIKSKYELIAPRLNSELLLSKSPTVSLYPGNVYKVQVQDAATKRKFLETYFPRISAMQKDKYEIENIDGITLVELECTPLCDYSQVKQLRHRFLPGVLFKAAFRNSIDTTLLSLYKEIPNFILDNEVYGLVFDYRLFKSVRKENETGFSHNDFLFRLKNEVLIDIQARIASHINRPGIVTVS